MRGRQTDPASGAEMNSTMAQSSPAIFLAERAERSERLSLVMLPQATWDIREGVVHHVDDDVAQAAVVKAAERRKMAEEYVERYKRRLAKTSKLAGRKEARRAQEARPPPPRSPPPTPPKTVTNGLSTDPNAAYRGMVSRYWRMRNMSGKNKSVRPESALDKTMREMSISKEVRSCSITERQSDDTRSNARRVANDQRRTK